MGTPTPLASGLESPDFSRGQDVNPFLGLLAPTVATRLWLIVTVTLVGLAAAGVLGARIAGTTVFRPALRVLLGGGLAMLVTAAVGQLAHVSGL